MAAHGRHQKIVPRPRPLKLGNLSQRAVPHGDLRIRPPGGTSIFDTETRNLEDPGPATRGSGSARNPLGGKPQGALASRPGRGTLATAFFNRGKAKVGRGRGGGNHPASGGGAIPDQFARAGERNRASPRSFPARSDPCRTACSKAPQDYKGGLGSAIERKIWRQPETRARVSPMFRLKKRNGQGHVTGGWRARRASSSPIGQTRRDTGDLVGRGKDQAEKSSGLLSRWAPELDRDPSVPGGLFGPGGGRPRDAPKPRQAVTARPGLSAHAQALVLKTNGLSGLWARERSAQAGGIDMGSHAKRISGTWNLDKLEGVSSGRRKRERFTRIPAAENWGLSQSAVLYATGFSALGKQELSVSLLSNRHGQGGLISTEGQGRICCFRHRA